MKKVTVEKLRLNKETLHQLGEGRPQAPGFITGSIRICCN